MTVLKSKLKKPQDGALSGTRHEVSRALSLGAMLLIAVYGVARPLANQFAPYSADSAFAALALCLLGGVCGILVLLHRSIALPRSHLLCALLWTGLLVWGAVRSPNMGHGIPYAVDFVSYILLLLCGYILAQYNRETFSIVVRSVIAMTVVEAFTGLWQHFVELPRVLRLFETDSEVLPDLLKSTAGNARLHGGNVFGSFAYPNSLSIYVGMGFLLLAGSVWATWRTSPSQSQSQSGMESEKPTRPSVFMALILWGSLGFVLIAALKYTDSKGTFVAVGGGLWALFLFKNKQTHPRMYWVLKNFSFLVLFLGITALILATLGILDTHPFGLSLQVRFEYWKSALRMILLEPIQGVGLAGFSEHYAFFKTAIGTEVKEVHNDYLQLWVELGPLGLLTYLGTWFMILRTGCVGSNSGMPSGQSIGNSDSEIGASRRFEGTVFLGAVMAFVFMGVAFQTLNFGDVLRLFETDGANESGVISGAFFALAAPVLFICVFIATRRIKNDAAMILAVKAVLIAVLLHEMIDFDLRAQAVLGTSFFLGGMLLALKTPTEIAPFQSVKSVYWLSCFDRLGRFFPLVLSLILLPLAVWTPAQSGLARTNAESLEDEAHALAAKPSSDVNTRALFKLRAQAAYERLAALNYAPYDADAWMDLAFSLEALSEPERKESGLNSFNVVELLEKSARKRPFSHIPLAQLGHHFSRNGDWKNAALWYQRAGVRYPFHPGIKLWLGDALLMDGHAIEAATFYLEAFTLDQQINDTNVRLSAIYTDPRAGVFPRHRRDLEIFQEVNHCLSSKNLDERTLRGLRLRKVVGLCALVRESERLKTGTEKTRNEFTADIQSTLAQFLNQLTDVGERAHATFHSALSYEITDLDKNVSAEKNAAWTLAKQAHAEAQQAGKLSTEQSLFDRLRLIFDR
jgi:hypothetical protein